MSPAAALIGPIAAATIVNTIVLAFAWRWDQQERRTGKSPWQQGLLLMGWLVIVGGSFYLRRNAPTSTNLDYFVVALLAEMMGGLVVYTLLHGFLYSRGKPFRERAFPALMGTFLAFIMFATLFSAR